MVGFHPRSMIEPISNSIPKPTLDEQYMRIAIDQAKIAEENGDVPIGAVIVHNNQIIAKAYNQREQLQDPTAHAEIIALTQAAAALENWHLNGCTMYVTLEPCCMCAGALVLARIDRLVYGCDDPKTGAVKSLYNIVQDSRLNHRVELTSGVLADECSKLLTEFFQKRRPEGPKSEIENRKS
jgi:tRNA(adenine34) deaminase